MTMPAAVSGDEGAILATAGRHGLALVGDVTINDMGLDFRVAFATDEAGDAWVLRLPRRPDVVPRADYEARVLRFVADRLPVAVPDWKVVSPELIAYPRLAGTPALTFDPATHEPTWHMDRQAPALTSSLAGLLVALHGIPTAEAAVAGLRIRSPEAARQAFADDLDQVRREVGIGEPLWRRWRSWIDDDASWPPFTTPVHGDLYAGHVLVDADSRATGVLDWTEAEVNDPAIDFTGHLLVFGEDGLERLLSAYEAAGGRTWPGMRRQIGERLSAAPVRYALFAMASGLDDHLNAARAQLGVDAGS